MIDSLKWLRCVILIKKIDEIIARCFSCCLLKHITEILSLC